MGEHPHQQNTAAGQPVFHSRDPGVLLIHPPLGTWDKPYLSLPVLASYLMAKGFKVDVLDANMEFYHRLLSRELLDAGSSFAGRRLAQLNASDRLDMPESIEFCRLVRALLQSQFVPPEPAAVLDAAMPLPHWKRRFMLDSVIRLVTAPYFPEAIELPSYLSPFSEYCSGDILRATTSRSIVREILADILEPWLQRPDLMLVGLSLGLPNQVLPAFQAARLIKERRPDVHVTLGGSMVSCHMRSLGNPKLFQLVDSLVVDDGERPLEALICELATRRPDLGQVPGLTYPTAGRIIRNEVAVPPHLAALPAPAYEVLPLDRYPLPRRQLKLPFRLSRGCQWHRCTFCRTDLPLVYHHQQLPAQLLFEQLEELAEGSGIRHFQFIDDSASPQLLEQLSERLVRGRLDITWFTNIRFSPRITPGFCSLLRRAGCRELKLGLESFNDRVLRLMRKGITTRLIDRVLNNASTAGLNVFANMIVGFPTETEKEALDSFEAIWNRHQEGLIHGYVYSTFHILPYSDIAENPERYGITRMQIPPNFDLEPPITSFETEGMGRATARRLEARFNGARGGGNVSLEKLKRSTGPRSVTADGKEIRLRHDLQALREMLGAREIQGWSYREMVNEGPGNGLEGVGSRAVAFPSRTS